jgi:predicted phage terminase large subunit-like protein
MYLQPYQTKAKAVQERRRRDVEALCLAERVKSFNSTLAERESLLKFVLYTKPDYIVNWHHEYLCKKLDEFAEGKIKRMMVFMPPQHGKSELVSRRFPAYLLGRSPDLKYIGASYSEELACSFNRETQRIIEDETYAEIFDLSKDYAGKRKYLKRSDMFEVEGYSGYYKSVGVGGSLTGFSADILSIDDPVKGPEQAFSEAFRRTVWEWYTDVVETRLNNNSRVLLTMTRWHEDDLAGRLLQLEKDKWTVISFPAIKECDENDIDKRKAGEPLWPRMHSLERINDIRSKSERTFISLYQQRPAPEEGNLLKKQWFKYFYLSDLPEECITDFYTDTAYGKENSDNSATISYSIADGCIYIRDVWVVNLNYPVFKKSYTDYISTHGYDHRSECVFEPKASGISIVQDLKESTLSGGQKINVIEDTPPRDDKLTRVMASSPPIESGRIFLLKGAAWLDRFLDECASFPNGKYDDQVDALSGIILRRFKHEPEPQIRRIE